MSNLIPANIKVPAHIAARMKQPSALNTSLAGGIANGGGYPRISIKGSRFRIIEDGAESVLDTTVLEVVIVGANPRLSKTFYAEQWSKDSEPAGPDCFSLDGVKPDSSVAAPENDVCASCPNNAWGSRVAPNGQQLKACSDQKRLAVVSADDPTGAIYLLQVTPAALKGLNTYQKELSMRGIPAEVVKTKIGFDTDASFPKLKFGFGGFLDEDTQAAVDELFGSDPVLEITGEKVVEVAPVPVPKAVAKPKPAPVVVEKEEEEPAPKRGFGAKSKPAPAVVEKEEEGEEPASKKRGRPAATEKPAAKSKASDDNLVDELAALIAGMDDD
jgi:hypothetical protein